MPYCIRSAQCTTECLFNEIFPTVNLCSLRSLQINLTFTFYWPSGSKLPTFARTFLFEVFQTFSFNILLALTSPSGACARPPAGGIIKKNLKNIYKKKKNLSKKKSEAKFGKEKILKKTPDFLPYDEYIMHAK